MISIFYGTRPEYLKVISVYEEFKKRKANVELVRVNQHTDLIENFPFDREISVHSRTDNRLNDLISSCLMPEVFLPETEYVIVQGDTATTYGISLNAFNSQIPIGHIEAGLRSYNRKHPYPEESYRRCVSTFANSHFCVTDVGHKNLQTERIDYDDAIVVGNTVLDRLPKVTPRYSNEVLVTLHRRENARMIPLYLKRIEKLAEENRDLVFTVPLHPNMKKHKSLLKYANPCDPLEHNQIIDILINCLFVITDSGGIQEESAFYRKHSLVCREYTERVEGLGKFSTLCRPRDVYTIGTNMIQNKDQRINCFGETVCPYGDGNASKKIVDHILKEVL